MCSMANNRKTHNISRASGDVNRTAPQSGDETHNLKRGLAELDQQEKDYMENLANSLLKLQNAALPQSPEEQETEKTPPSTPKKESP